MNEITAPVYEAMLELRKRRVVPFDVPGHKRGRGNPELVDFLGEKCVGVDVNSMKMLDNLSHPVSVIKEAEELTADAFGAQKAFFMVHGTTSAVQHFQQVARELKVVMPISFYEKDGTRLFNSIAMLDADGEVLGVYRKTHIPDDHYYQEKFYFTPGNTGFKVWDTRYGKVGGGICWDQWFPEAARAMALQGAEILLYPTAIGSEPILEIDSMPHWRRCMQGHAGSNLVPVIAANRIGMESVEPCAKNGGQSSSLNFYGSSFITDNTGAIITEANRTEEQVLTAEVAALRKYCPSAYDSSINAEIRDREIEYYFANNGRYQEFPRIVDLSMIDINELHLTNLRLYVKYK